MKSVFLLTFLILICSAFVEAQDSGEPQIFEAPTMIRSVTPQYPSIDALNYREGWVLLNFMVDTDGKAFEPTVIGSTGPGRLERAAIGALMRSKFTPAYLSGTAVEGSSYYKYVFSMKGKERRARTSFMDIFKNLIGLIAKKNQQEAENVLQELVEEGSGNHYETALLDLVRFQYASVYGTKLEQMKYLNNALGFESRTIAAGYLPPELAQQSRRQLFALQIENKRYEGAILTYQTMVNKGDESAVVTHQTVYEQLLEQRDNEFAFVVPAATNSNGYWSIRLHKRTFHVDSRGNQIDELKLRCDKKYIFFAFEREQQYQIPGSWGKCLLQVLGAENVSFDLHQF